jgi:hypothetical protein
MEQTYTLINAIIVVHGSATSGVLPPTILENIGKFTEHVSCRKTIFSVLTIHVGLCIKSTHLWRLKELATKSKNSSVRES